MAKAGDRNTSASPTTGSLLGVWVRHARKEQGLSQRALADQSGLSRSYVCDIERGRGSEPSLSTMDKLAAALGASRADLMHAAGFIDRAPVSRESDDERRLLAVYRDLTGEGRLGVMRYARFLHQEEHAWTQSSLIGDETEQEGRPVAPMRSSLENPTLFDMDG